MKQVFSGFYSVNEMFDFIATLHNVISYRWDKNTGNIEVEFGEGEYNDN